jgi:hypothetical protein
MRGFPLFNLIAVVAVLLLMLWPLLRVDRPVVVPETADVTVPVPAGIPVLVALRFVKEPSAVQVRLGEEVLTLRGSGLERQAEARLIPAERALELAVEAVWPAGTGSSVVEVRAAPDGLPEQQQNLWGEDGAVTDIIRFTWRAQP